jgi:hypothetical protein
VGPYDPADWTSRDLGTHDERLWLLPSGPDQVHRATMRGGPSILILTTGAKALPRTNCPNGYSNTLSGPFPLGFLQGFTL